MDFESIVKNGMIVLEGAQAINFLLQSIKIFIGKLKSLSFNKAAIDNFNDDKWFTKFSKVVVDENVITDLPTDFKQPTDIYMSHKRTT